MICPNCKLSIKENTKYCNHCGIKIQENQHDNLYQYSKSYSNAEDNYQTYHDQFTYSEIYSNINSETVNSEEDYINAFIGQNHNIIKNNNISFSALILGPFYLLYRRMNNLGISLLLFETILFYYYPNIGILTHIIISIYLGIKFPSLYISFVNRHVDEIKISNPDKSSTELLEECKKKGNPKILPIIITIIINFLVILMILEEKNLLQNQTIVSNDSSSIGKLQYEVPAKFNEKTNGKNDYYKQYRNSNHYCYITIEANKDYNSVDSAKEYIEKYIYLSPQETITEQNSININNNEWIVQKRESNIDKKEIYITKYKNYYYIIHYYEYSNRDCSKEKNELINTLHFEE